MEKKFSNVQAIKYGFIAFFEHVVLFIKVGLAYIFSSAVVLGIVGASAFYLIRKPFMAIGSLIKEQQDLMKSAGKNITPEVQAELKRIMGEIFAKIDLKVGLVLLGLFIVISLFLTLLSLGLTRIGLDVYDKKKSTVGRLFSQRSLVLKTYFGSILYSILVLLGNILLIIPGIIIALMYGFFEVVLVDKHTSISQAFSKSRALVYGHKWKILGLVILLAVINQIAAYAFGIGMLITVPASKLAWIYVYRKLQGK